VDKSRLSMIELDDLFMQAAETERRLPAAFRRQKLASWPEYVQEWSAYGWDDFVAPIGKASPAQVTAYEKALILGIEHMNKDDRRLVWAVAHSAAFRERGPAWTKIGKMLGNRDGRTVKRMYQDALVRLYYKLPVEDDDEILGDLFS